LRNCSRKRDACSFATQGRRSPPASSSKLRTRITLRNTQRASHVPSRARSGPREISTLSPEKNLHDSWSDDQIRRCLNCCLLSKHRVLEAKTKTPLHGTGIAVYIAGQERRLVDPPSQVVAGVRTVTTNMDGRDALPRMSRPFAFIGAAPLTSPCSGSRFP